VQDYLVIRIDLQDFSDFLESAIRSGSPRKVRLLDLAIRGIHRMFSG
jgi:uncharacterized protein (UPF0262 family)